MELSDSFIKKTRKKVTEHFSDVYDNHVLPNRQIDFAPFLDSIFNEIITEISDLLEVTEENVTVYLKRIRSTKGRWFKKEMESSYHKGFYKDIEIVAKSLYEDLLKNEEQFYQIYGYRTLDDLRAARLEELQQWTSSTERYLSHFRYIKDKTTDQIITALKNDIKYLVFKEIKKKCPRGKQSAIPSLPLSISKLPIDYTNRAKINDENLIVDGREKFFLDKYYIDDATIFESRINTEILKTGVIREVLKKLNSKDIQIFLTCMSLADEKFYTTREIMVDIGDLVREVHHSDGKKNYIAVKESLYRLQYLNSGVIDGSLRGFTTKIFDNVEILKISDNKETAKIIVNIDIVNEYVKNNTVSMYKEVIDQFKLESSKVAIFPIQRERIRVDASSVTKDRLLFQTNYNFFRGILYFSNKRKREHIKTIENMLDEIVSNRITIKGYERKGDKFTLEFYPITEQERMDLLDQQGVRKIIGNVAGVLEQSI